MMWLWNGHTISWWYCICQCMSSVVHTDLDLKPRDLVTPAHRELHWLPVAERIQYKLCLLVQKSLLGHAGIYLRPSDIRCQYSRSIYTARFIVWQPSRAANTSTNNWRQSLFCCCTTSVERATDGAETAAIDGLVSSWSENISVSFCLRAPGHGSTLWCALGILVGAQYKCLCYSYSYSNEVVSYASANNKRCHQF